MRSPSSSKTKGRWSLVGTGRDRGTAEPLILPEINEATVRLLTRHGCEVVVARGSGCCGAIDHHLGRQGPALEAVRANVAAWTREIDTEGLDAVVVNASGCGTMVKDYGFLLQEDAAWAGKAARVSGLARDIAELMAELGLDEPAVRPGLEVAYHSACSLQHMSGLVGAKVEVTLGIHADIPDGAPDHVVRTVTENCRTLRFKDYDFEKE